MDPCTRPFGFRFLRGNLLRISGLIILLLVIAGLMPIGSLLAEGDQAIRSQRLQAYVDAYEKKCAKLRKPIVELRDQYLDRLKTLQENAQKKGELETVLAIHREIKLVEENQLSEESEVPDSLRGVRGIYERERQSREASAESFIQRERSSLIRDLEELQRKQVQEGKTELAIETRNMVEKYQEEAKPPPLIIELFWETDFQGESVKLEVPVKIDRFSEHPTLKNDQLRSIKIPDGVRVEIGTGYALGGKSKTLRRDTADTDFPGVSSIEAK